MYLAINNPQAKQTTSLCDDLHISSRINSSFVCFLDVSKGKPQPGRRSISQPKKDNESAKKGKKDEKKRLPVKRKREESPEESMEANPVNDHQVEKDEMSIKLEENPSASWSASKPSGIQDTIEPDADQSIIKSEETQSTRVKTKQTRSLAKSARSKPTPGQPKKPRSRKILRLSSDESEGEVEVMWASGGQNVTGANIQVDSDEVLAAVRVELDENEFSDDGQPVNVFKKWEDSATGSNAVRAAASLTSSVPNGQNAMEDQQKKPFCTIPADMDHVVAVNERRTRYRYIYRVGQCFPEEDDDVPFIKSKLNFVIKALQSQNEKVCTLKKRCRELSRSNTTLRDILGIPSTDNNDELLEAEELEPQQEAYLIIGSLPSSSASLPLYRFTLTDRLPTVITQVNSPTVIPQANV